MKKQTKKIAQKVREDIEKSSRSFIRNLEKGEGIAPQSVFRNCRQLPELLNRMKSGYSSTEIAKFLLENDESLSQHYENSNVKDPVNSLSTAIRYFRKKTFPDQYFPPFKYQSYARRIESQFNEIEELQNITAYLMERIDLAHDIELQTKIPFDGAREDVKVLANLLIGTAKLKSELGIDIKPQEKQKQINFTDLNIKKYEKNIQKIVQENINYFQTLDTTEAMKEATRMVCCVPSLKRLNPPKKTIDIGGRQIR